MLPACLEHRPDAIICCGVILISGSAWQSLQLVLHTITLLCPTMGWTLSSVRYEENLFGIVVMQAVKLMHSRAQSWRVSLRRFTTFASEEDLDRVLQVTLDSKVHHTSTASCMVARAYWCGIGCMQAGAASRGIFVLSMRALGLGVLRLENEVQALTALTLTCTLSSARPALTGPA